MAQQTEKEAVNNSRADITALLVPIEKLSTAIKNKVQYFILLSLVASGYLAWLWFSSESSMVWNATKICLVSLPMLAWLVFWYVLGQLQGLPDMAQSLSTTKFELSEQLTMLNNQQGSQLKRLFKLLYILKTDDGLAEIMEVSGSVMLVANPIFAIMIFLSASVLLCFIVVAFFILIL